MINDPAIVTDSLNWVRIFGSFTADSAYEFIVIGNFFDDVNTDTLIMNGDSICYFSYYFLDDVCISTDSLFSLNYLYADVDNGESHRYFSVQPCPTTDVITIDAFGIYSNYDVKIYSSIGELLYEETAISDKLHPINLINLPAQILLIQIQNESFVSTIKILKL